MKVFGVVAGCLHSAPLLSMLRGLELTGRNPYMLDPSLSWLEDVTRGDATSKVSSLHCAEHLTKYKEPWARSESSKHFSSIAPAPAGLQRRLKFQSHVRSLPSFITGANFAKETVGLVFKTRLEKQNRKSYAYSYCSKISLRPLTGPLQRQLSRMSIHADLTVTIRPRLPTLVPGVHLFMNHQFWFYRHNYLLLG